MPDLSIGPVAPRVISPATGDPVLLVDKIEWFLGRGSDSFILISGELADRALQHLAKAFEEEVICGKLRLLGTDGRTISCAPAFSVASANAPYIVTVTLSRRRGFDEELQLATWSRDDWIEYLLSQHPTQCADVMARLRLEDVDFAEGSPTVWQMILDRMATDPQSNEVASIAATETRRRFPDFESADKVADVMIAHGEAAVEMEGVGEFLSPELKVALLNNDLAFAFTSLRMLARLKTRDLSDQKKLMCMNLSASRADRLAQLVGSDESIRDRLRRIFGKGRSAAATSAAMVLCRCSTDWKPKGRRMRLRYGNFRDVCWNELQLERSDLTAADFSGASLQGSRFGQAKLDGARFRRANLRGVDLSDARRTKRLAKIRLKWDRSKLDGDETAGSNQPVFHDLAPARQLSADFFSADLRNSLLTANGFYRSDFSAAKLNGARGHDVVFRHCRFDTADLSGACFHSALIENTDFQSVAADQTDFSAATFRSVNFENAIIKEANFQGSGLGRAEMTQSTMMKCDFRNTNLTNTKLAEIDWEECDLRGADLRGADFHLGSTRSGIVDSPYPSHGTRTGFYTDEYEEQYFQQPEMIRKANLYGADLRGAITMGVDFYLVDLRTAKLDPWQRTQMAATGAILDD